MKKDIDLTEILKDVPQGTKFYSTVYGWVTLEGVVSQEQFYPIAISVNDSSGFSSTERLTKEGFLCCGFNNAECVIFPSDTNRDWSNWTYERPDLPVRTIVLFSDSKDGQWLLGRYHGKGSVSFVKLGSESAIIRGYKYIIPLDKFNAGDIEKSIENYNYSSKEK